MLILLWLAVVVGGIIATVSGIVALATGNGYGAVTLLGGIVLLLLAGTLSRSIGGRP